MKHTPSNQSGSETIINQQIKIGSQNVFVPKNEMCCGVFISKDLDFKY